MNVIFRLLIAGLLLGGTIMWVPAMATAASTPGSATDPAMRGPLTQDNDEGDNQDNTEDDNQDNSDGDDNDSASDNNDGVDNGNANDNNDGNGNGNANDNDDSSVTVDPPTPSAPNPNPGVTGDPSMGGMQIDNGGLIVDLWRSTDRPVANTPFQLGVTGSGAPIERVSIWAESPGGITGPANDDFALAGERFRDCAGINPCDQSWTLIARNVGIYTIHAKVRDTSGREVQTDWRILFSDNPR